MAQRQLLGVTTYQRQAQVLRWVWMILPLIFVGLIGLILTQPVSFVIPFSLFILTLALVVVLAILRWPIFGIYVTIFGVALFEPFPLEGDPSTYWTWIFHANLQSWSVVTLPFSIVELVMIVTAIAWLFHPTRGERLLPPWGMLGRPMLIFAVCIIGGYLYGTVLRAGGDSRVALWEVRALAYLVLMYFLVGGLFRSIKQIKVITWLLVIGLTLNAIRLIWRSTIFESVAGDENMISGLAHENALFLAMLLFYFIAQLTFGRWNAQRWVLIAAAPLAVYALMVSQRRAAFVVLFLSMGIWAIFTYLRRRRLFMVLVPALTIIGTIYVGAFWNSSGAVGQPARAVRSIISPNNVSERDQQSDLYRRIEEFNIWRTIRDEPILGLGFGRQFNTYIPLPYISGWEFQLYTPHNQVFWLWLKMGVVGFVVGLWLFGLGLVRGVQLMLLYHEPTVKPFVLMATAYIVMALTFSYVDIGLANGRAMIMMGLLLGMIGKLPTVLLPEVARQVLPGAFTPAGQLQPGLAARLERSS